jgi:outer membrane lipoprotein SlyB
MNTKQVIWFNMIAGSALGGLLPAFFGEPGQLIASVFGSAIGGLLGIWLGFKITRGW